MKRETSVSYLDWSVGNVATQLPGATAVLFQHKINFCCEANMRLMDVIRKKNIDEAIISDALTRLADKNEHSTDYEALSNVALIEHILVRFHEVHRAQLSELIRLAQRVEHVHVAHPKCPRGLASHLIDLKEELENHMQKEENILFPMLSQEFAPMASGPISVMKEEHLDHMQGIDEIYRLTDDVTLHAGACNTWTALYLGLQEFITDLNMHIHIENDILFTRAN
jgi:regulator of cell morphogenesis and NO signaling